MTATRTAPTGPAPAPVRARDAEVLRGDPNGTITLLADPEHTAGLLTSNRSLLRAGSIGAPPHLHVSSAEVLHVLDGALDVLLDEQVTTLTAGDLLVVPPGTTHAFAPAAGSDADVFVLFTPGTARFDYYRLLDRVHRGEADPQEIADSQDRFDNHYVDSPVWRSRGHQA